MRAILMSIKPKWCELIFGGEKTIEVRKTALETPFKVYVYETQGATETPWVDKDGDLIWKGRGQVVGEFVCDEKYDIQFAGASYMINNDISLTNGIARQSCLWYDDMFSYLGVKGGAALHITKPKRYDKPKNIKKFRKPCPYGDLPCRECPSCEEDESGYIQCFNTVNRPPQSFCYVEEIEE